MKHYQQKLAGVCSTRVAFDLDNGVVRNVVFENGCDGNLKAVGKLTEGMDAKKVVSLLKGNTCGPKNTSCADQFARALGSALAEQEK